MTSHHYRSTAQAALDLAYNNLRAGPDYSAMMDRFKNQSDVLYRSTEARRDIAYGRRPRQRFDCLSCGRRSGVRCERSTRTRLNVAIAEYTLARRLLASCANRSWCGQSGSGGVAHGAS